MPRIPLKEGPYGDITSLKKFMEEQKLTSALNDDYDNAELDDLSRAKISVGIEKLVACCTQIAEDQRVLTKRNNGS